MITKLSDPAIGFEIWRRFLEEWEPAHRGRYRAMLMQLLQFPFAGDRCQAMEEWERLVRQYEAQSSDTLQDTIKAATLAHNLQYPVAQARQSERDKMQRYDALRIEWKAMHQAYRPWGMADGNEATPMEVDALTKGIGKVKGKEKGKDKPKEGTSDKSSVKCFFCKEKGHAPSSRPGSLRKRQWVTSRARMPSRKKDRSLPCIMSMRSSLGSMMGSSGIGNGARCVWNPGSRCRSHAGR